MAWQCTRCGGRFSTLGYVLLHDCSYDEQAPVDREQIERLIDAAPPILREIIEHAARQRPEDWRF
jgi:hypothetical protein